MKYRRFFISVALLLGSLLPLAAVAELTPVEVNDDVSCVTGGIGLEESTAIREFGKK
jgi:hypothetical protein